VNPHAIPQSDGDCPLVGENYERENAVTSTEEQAEPVTSGHRGHRAIPDEPHVATDPDGTVLFVDARSAAWRRRLGPLGWAALEHLALASRLDDQGWAAPIGVRAVATSIGVTKDTAARAITILAAAGLVTRESVTTPGGGRRSGYRLHLPDGLELRTHPQHQDTPCQQQQTRHCPKIEDSRSCPTNQDTTPTAGIGTLTSTSIVAFGDVVGPEGHPHTNHRGCLPEQTECAAPGNNTCPDGADEPCPIGEDKGQTGGHDGVGPAVGTPPDPPPTGHPPTASPPSQRVQAAPVQPSLFSLLTLPPGDSVLSRYA